MLELRSQDDGFAPNAFIVVDSDTILKNIINLISNHHHHCTMGKLKNGVKSSQLWQIISLWILAQNLPNLAQSCRNSPKTQINTNIWNKYFTNEKKSKEPVGGVYASQDWTQKTALAKRISFYKRYILRNHPQIAKN